MKRGMMSRPHLTFFCEFETGPLQALFLKPEVIQQIKAMNAQVSLGLLDLSQGRANVVRRLNEEEIPVTAWLLLPKEQGYWFNLDNADMAASRYGAFKVWSAENGLRWAGIGLDIEPDIQLVQEMMRNRPGGLKKILKKMVNGERLQKAVFDYRTLVILIRAEGYFVESYQIPFIQDERKVGSNIIQRFAGLVDLDVDREVLMLYTSFLRPYGPGLLWDYASGAGGVGVGNTGGGVQMEGFKEPNYLDWKELQRDLRLAYQHTDNIYIFSLEGCVMHGFMPGLVDFDWKQTPVIPIDQVKKVRRFRKLARVVLWTLSHPGLVIMSGLGLFWLFRKRKS
jgi:hypothetical protein